MNDLEKDIVERLTYTQLQSVEYRQAYESERKAYRRLVKELTEKQMNAFDEYYGAAVDTLAITKKLAYKQGIADLVNMSGH